MTASPTAGLRSGAFATALAGAVLLLLLQAAPGLHAVLEYRRQALPAEPWRLLTAHLVHVNWIHALVNAGAWLALALLFERSLDARRQLLCLVLSGISIAFALAWLYPSVTWYRGASGMLHALFFAGASMELVAALQRRSRPALLLAFMLLAGGGLKIALQLPDAGATPYVGWLDATTVPQAHLLGALFGVPLGVLVALFPRVGR
jgi:rhomboid family GlyGly-CTERM serine protease